MRRRLHAIAIGATALLTGCASIMALIQGSPLSAALAGLGLVTLSAVLLFTPQPSNAPDERDLKALTQAARRLGNESFLNVEVSHPSLQGVADAFNDMSGQLRRVVAGREELLRAVSHELRTPVARLSFAVDLLAGQQDRAERERRAEAIQNDIAELESLIAELMTYTALQDEQLHTEVKPLDPGPLVNQIITNARLSRYERTVKCSEGDLPNILADKRLFARALDNLVRNAVKYSKSTVSLSWELEPQHVRFLVDDDGPGVPMADRARIFEALVRLDPARSRDTGGIGLGLSLARRIAIAHGGRLMCTDSPLGGARFSLSIPRQATSGTL